MNLMDLFIKISVDDQASGAIGKITGGIGKGLATAAKVGTAAVGAAAAGITALTKASIGQYAEYEQLVGGVETLFKSSGGKVVEYAQNAYKTAGLSANDYMNTVTSFSASLIQSLGGDTQKAAEYADVAITDMADNANKMGSDIATLQTAYAGFAKGNFTLLDNLKIGYGGTKEEMERLLADAEKISGIKYDISSFADITQAIHVMQEEMGIAGATALEAGTTIQGSIGAMKGAWTNLITGLAGGNADIGELIDNLVTTIVGDGTESNLGVLGNILPAVERALGGVVKLIGAAAPKIIEILPEIVQDIAPALIDAAVKLVDAVVLVLPDLLEVIMQAIVDHAPEIVKTLVKLSVSLISALAENLPLIIETLFSLVDEIFVALSEIDWESIGKDIVDGILGGLEKAWDGLSNWFTKAWDGLVGGVKDLLGIHSPSRVFAGIGKNMALGVGEGWQDEFGRIKDGINDSVSFDDVAINANVRRHGFGSVGVMDGQLMLGGAGLATAGGVTNWTVNVNGIKQLDELVRWYTTRQQDERAR